MTFLQPAPWNCTLGLITTVYKAGQQGGSDSVILAIYLHAIFSIDLEFLCLCVYFFLPLLLRACPGDSSIVYQQEVS